MTHKQRWRSRIQDGEPEAPTGLLKLMAGICQMCRRPAPREDLGPLGFWPRKKQLCGEAEQELLDTN